MSTTIDSLSAEILLRILYYIDSKADLLTLCLVSRRFSRITTPMIYKHIHLCPGTRLNWLRPLAFSLLNNTALAELVQSLTVRNGECCMTHGRFSPVGSEQAWPDHPNLPYLLRSAVRRYVRDERGCQAYIGWLEEEGHAAFILTLLLPTLTNLVSLDVSPDLSPTSNYTLASAETLLRMLVPESGLQKPNDCDAFISSLENMLISAGEEHDDKPTGDGWAGTFVRLPNLKRLFCVHLDGEDAVLTRMHPKDFSPSSLRLEHMEMQDSAITMESLKLLLSLPKSLNTFILTCTGREGQRLPIPIAPVRTNELSEALQLQRQSLERLQLDHTDTYYFPTNLSNDLSPMNLSMFEVLSELRIAPILAYGRRALHLDDEHICRMDDSEVTQEELATTRYHLTNALPPSLEVLHFTHCQDLGTFRHIADSLENLLTQKRSSHRLCKIIFQGSFRRQPFMDVMATVLKLCRQQNITFSVYTPNKCTIPNKRAGKQWGWRKELPRDPWWESQPYIEYGLREYWFEDPEVSLIRTEVYKVPEATCFSRHGRMMDIEVEIVI